MLKGISRCIYTVAILTFGLSAITVLARYTDEASQQAVAAFTSAFGNVLMDLGRMLFAAAKQVTMEILTYLLNVLAAM